MNYYITINCIKDFNLDGGQGFNLNFILWGRHLKKFFFYKNFYFKLFKILKEYNY